MARQNNSWLVKQTNKQTNKQTPNLIGTCYHGWSQETGITGNNDVFALSWPWLLALSNWGLLLARTRAVILLILLMLTYLTVKHLAHARQTTDISASTSVASANATVMVWGDGGGWCGWMSDMVLTCSDGRGWKWLKFNEEAFLYTWA
jgi:hypothetical protein